MKTTTHKLASMILKMFDGDAECAYRYSVGLLEADMAYAPIVTIIKDQLPSDFFDVKQEKKSPVVSTTTLEEVFPANEASKSVYNEGWFKFQPPTAQENPPTPSVDHTDDHSMNLPDPYDQW